MPHSYGFCRSGTLSLTLFLFDGFFAPNNSLPLAQRFQSENRFGMLTIRCVNPNGQFGRIDPVARKYQVTPFSIIRHLREFISWRVVSRTIFGPPQDALLILQHRNFYCALLRPLQIANIKVHPENSRLAEEFFHRILCAVVDRLAGMGRDLSVSLFLALSHS
jgi:hypothetical protein